MPKYPWIRHHIEFDLDMQAPPTDTTLMRMIREAIDNIIKGRYCKARNLKIVRRDLIDKHSNNH